MELKMDWFLINSYYLKNINKMILICADKQIYFLENHIILQLFQHTNSNLPVFSEPKIMRFFSILTNDS